jgi:hypothetical protein
MAMSSNLMAKSLKLLSNNQGIEIIGFLAMSGINYKLVNILDARKSGQPTVLTRLLNKLFNSRVCMGGGGEGRRGKGGTYNNLVNIVNYYYAYISATYPISPAPSLFLGRVDKVAHPQSD